MLRRSLFFLLRKHFKASFMDCKVYPYRKRKIQLKTSLFEKYLLWWHEFFSHSVAFMLTGYCMLIDEPKEKGQWRKDY